MKQKIKKFIAEAGILSLSLSIAFILVMGISIVRGWVNPTDTAPNGNVGAPINTSAVTQNKAGALGIGGILDVLGSIHSIGDICTDAGGGKCLSGGGGVDMEMGTVADGGTIPLPAGVSNQGKCKWIASVQEAGGRTGNAGMDYTNVTVDNNRIVTCNFSWENGGALRNCTANYLIICNK